MGVDTIWIRRLASISEANGKGPLAEVFVELTAEIDSLRAEVGRLKAAAVPWRKGPAGGREMPEAMETRSVLLVVIAPSGQLGIATGVFRRMDSEYITLKFDPKYDSAYALSSIVRWCYVVDLLPAPEVPSDG